ncbi:MAG: hypothetical protein ACOX0A_07120 [Thermoguttaceae bacterium]
MSNNTIRIGSKKCKIGRPRRKDNYEKVSFTISVELLGQVDDRAREWGMNRSSTVSRIVQTQLDAASSGNCQQMRETLEQINDVLMQRKAG